ncbi:hypothetical protein [Tsukamurella sp. 8J]|uniref:hypothetical protein n=1 Tax=Tsukamurella sp. 8J TaxID=3031962 RepID=UPI0023B8F1B7|nr:hypothetical protein [Tsukamurella sp. 8J]MDF0530048.1 hypothetical protein [Tsukamurella sp. 8J]
MTGRRWEWSFRGAYFPPAARRRPVHTDRYRTPGGSPSRAAADLPDLHRDPFDRILIGQAKVERLTLVTRDAAIHRYDVDTLEV